MMPQPRVHRTGYRWIVWIIPVVGVCCLATLLLAPAAPGLLLRVIGFQPRGNVEEVLDRAVPSTPFAIEMPPAPPGIGGGIVTNTQPGPMPTPVVVSGPVPTVVVVPAVVSPGGNASDSGGQPAGGNIAAAPPSGAAAYAGWFRTVATPPSLNLSGPGGSFAVNTADSYASTVWVGTGVDGYPLGLVEYRENALDGLCRTWLQNCAIEQARLTSVDFRPGGLIAYGTVNLGQIAQDIGVAVALGADRKSLVPVGVVVNNQVYAVPAEGQIADMVNDIVSRANNILRDVRVQAGGYTLSLVEIGLTNDGVMFVLR